ncbi:MAG: tRNA (cytidine(34)-2'-O)-methyltransferase [Gammaproteobacteria bacterium]
MFDIVLHEPEIPPNTGNIIRLCANTGARLHLVEPLGFRLDDRDLRRAGLDYHEYASVRVHAGLDACLDELGGEAVYAFTTRATQGLDAVRFAAGSVLLFGAETRGLPAGVLARFPPARWVRLPMVPSSRSLNLSNAVAIAVYEAWRQNGYAGAG